MSSLTDKLFVKAMSDPKSETVSVVATGKAKTVAFRTGMTLGNALDESGVTVGDQDEVRVNGVEAPDDDMKLSAGDQVMVVQEIAGAH